MLSHDTMPTLRDHGMLNTLGMWLGSWLGIASAGSIATIIAQSLPETPTSVLVAFITVSMSALGLLGWVLRESLASNREYAKELASLNRRMAAIYERLGLREKEEDSK